MSMLMAVWVSGAALGQVTESVGPCQHIKNGGFESSVLTEDGKDTVRIDDWEAWPKAWTCKPGKQATTRPTSKQPYPSVSQGAQYAVLVLRKGQVDSTWLSQRLGQVTLQDVGKVYVATVDGGARLQDLTKIAELEVAFRTGVQKGQPGDSLGQPGRYPLLDGQGMRPVSTWFAPSANDVGKPISLVIRLTGVSVQSGSDQYVIDNARLTVGPADRLESMLSGLPRAASSLLAVQLWKQKGILPSDMMKRYLLTALDKAQKDWRNDYEQRKTPAQITAYQERLKARFVQSIGGLPERSPLNARTVGTVSKPGYRVEKVLFNSQPAHAVSAALFLPDPSRHKPPYPGVIVPCGHSLTGKAMDLYQRACALAALNGLAALIFDPIDQGERHQSLDTTGKGRFGGTSGHNMVAAGSIPLGRSTARYEIWDGMRCIDYLQSRSDIDPKRIGCMGNSGGGTQTAYLMALDDRIGAAAPSCYICSLYGRLIRNYEPQDAEQNIFGQLSWGMDHADYCMMRAPKPTLLCTATRDYFNIEDAWNAFRDAKRLYTNMGFSERMSLVEADEPHGYSLHLRQAAVRWMMRWLLGKDEAIVEPSDLKVLTEDEIRCTPKGEVLLLDGQRSVYDLNRDYARELAQKRKSVWDSTPRTDLLKRVRDIAGIREIGSLPRPKAEKVGTERSEGYRVDQYILVPEEGIYLPALLYLPQSEPIRQCVLYIHSDGKDADTATLRKIVASGQAVLAVDLRGIGETQSPSRPYFSADYHGRDGQDFFTAYLLGRCLMGMRAEDIRACALWLREGHVLPQNVPVHLVTVGQLGVPALHAAALNPDLFASVRLVRSLTSWSNVVELGFVKTPYSSMVHGALTVYDLPDLARLLGDKLTLEEPVDAFGRPAKR